MRAILLAVLLLSPTMVKAQTWGTAGQTGMIVITPLPNNVMPLANQVDNSLSIGVTGGPPGSVHSISHNLITLYGSPNSNFWTALDGLTYSGTGGTGQHVAHYDQTLRYGTGPQLWAGVAEMTDFSGLPSSRAGADLAYEYDLTGHSLDDAESRQMLSGVIRPASDSNNFLEATNGYNLTVKQGAYARRFYSGGGVYTHAAVDLRYAAPFNLGATSLSPIVFPVTTAAVSNSTVVPVSNVMPFTSSTRGLELNSSGAGNTVYIGGVAHTVLKYAVTGTGPTPAGTITLSTPVTLAKGVQVANNSAVIWLATGQPIKLDTDGATSIVSDGATVTVKGALAASMAGGATCAAGQVNPATMKVVNGVVTAC